MKQTVTRKQHLSLLVVLVGVLALAGIAWQGEAERHPLLPGFEPAKSYRELANKIDIKLVTKIVFDWTTLSWKTPGDVVITDKQEIRSIVEALRVASWPKSAQGIKNRGLQLHIKTTTGNSYRFNFAGLLPAWGFGPEFTEAINQIGLNRTREFKQILSKMKVDRIKLYSSLEIKRGKQLEEVLAAFQSADNLFDYVRNTQGCEVVFYPVSEKPKTFWIRIPREKIYFPYHQKRDPEQENPPLPQPLWRLICEGERLYAADFFRRENGENYRDPAVSGP